jgi:DNA-binding LacI/PurR family transcriptional regulator
VTIREIAKQVGVSPATVSRYLTGAEKVSRSVSEKIYSVMEAANCQIIRRTKSANGLVGVLVPNLEVGYYSDVLREIIEQIPGYGFQTVFIPTTENSKQSFKSLLRELKLSGLIFLEENIEEDILKIAQELRLKTVICGAASIGSQATMVHINDLAAAYEGTKYLIGLGHKRIAFFSDYPHAISVGFQRMVGCRKAMEEAGLDFNEKLIKCGNVIYEVGYQFTLDLIRDGADFTAIFAFSDEMAIGTINALYDSGLRVPDDISILGFDDLPIARRNRPALTTIHQPLHEIVKNTLDVFANPESSMANTAITLPYTVCERATCRRIDG